MDKIGEKNHPHILEEKEEFILRRGGARKKREV